jgi:AraC-like DNA-binding protein
LHCLWHVRADETYDVSWRRLEESRYVAIRTLEGAGFVEADGAGALPLGAGSLVVAPMRRIRHYATRESVWHFWWAEFELGLAAFFPVETVLHVERQAGEDSLLESAFSGLRLEADGQRAAASAALALQLHRWLAAAAEAGRRRHPWYRGVERVVAAMQERPDGSLRLADMARLAGLGERRFRTVFRELTGESPKRLYDGIRLERARFLLEGSPLGLAEIADRLGFSSAFHLSSAFRRRYGVPPGALRRRAS